jgi:hypothetical protein
VIFKGFSKIVKVLRELSLYDYTMYCPLSHVDVGHMHCLFHDEYSNSGWLSETNSMAQTSIS